MVTIISLASVVYFIGINVYLQEIGEFVGVMGIDVDVSNVIQNELQKYNVSRYMHVQLLSWYPCAYC
jgi:hypothetical protein